MYYKIYINYRGACLIAWLMFQTLLRRSALAAVFSSAVWVRDNYCAGNRAKLLAKSPRGPDWYDGRRKIDKSLSFVFIL
jgi:hypothetical protein